MGAAIGCPQMSLPTASEDKLLEVNSSATCAVADPTEGWRPSRDRRHQIRPLARSTLRASTVRHPRQPNSAAGETAGSPNGVQHTAGWTGPHGGILREILDSSLW